MADETKKLVEQSLSKRVFTDDMAKSWQKNTARLMTELNNKAAPPPPPPKESK